MPRAIPDWLLPVAAIVVLQTTASALTRVIPVAAPAFTVEFGWDSAVIGYLAAANSVGAIAALLVSATLVGRLGALGALQWALMVGAVSLALFLPPQLAWALAASFLVGLSYGAASPTGSAVLHRYAPASGRNLVFSIRQAGIPMGGVIAGLAVSPLVESAGWRIALLASGLLVVAAVAATWRQRARVDGPGGAPRPSVTGFSPARMVVAPLRALAERPGLARIAVAGGLLAAAQSGWFAFMVVVLVERAALSLPLAGAFFAAMMAASVLGRILLGWFTDRTGRPIGILMAAAALSAVTTALLGQVGPGWPLWAMGLLAVAGGAGAAGWNGVHVAEIARRAAPERIAETAAGSGLVVYIGNGLAPAAIAAWVSVTGRYDIAFIAAGICGLACLPLLASAGQGGISGPLRTRY